MKNFRRKIHLRAVFAAFLTVLIVGLFGPPPSEGTPTIIRHTAMVNPNDTRSQYYIDMLHLALSKTRDTLGDFVVQGTTQMNQSQAIHNLSRNLWIDVLWTMTSVEREELLLPVRIPLLKGLLGHRIFIVRRADKERFARIETLDELKRFSAGQGHDWPDTAILKANGFNVTTASTYPGLFDMLQMERFDFFPRGVNEPWNEVIRHADKDLIVEPTLMLYYPAPTYFFVNKENAALAERLEKGLKTAIEDGSFDELFRTHPANIPIFEQANLPGRKLFVLENPLLPPLTPLDVPEYWYFPVEGRKP